MNGTEAPHWVRRIRRALVVLGVGVMVYAAIGAVTDNSVRVGGHVVFLVAVLLAHDGILMPAGIGIGVLISRFVPAGARSVVVAAAFVSGAVVVVALPFALGFAAPDDGSSALPLDYGRGLFTALAAVWITALGTLAYRLRRRRPDHPRRW